jgi:hypothetical protein
MKKLDSGKELKKRVTGTARVAKSPQPINPITNTLRQVNDGLHKAKQKLPYKPSVNPIKKALIDRSNSKFTSSKVWIPGYGSTTQINGKSEREKNIDKNYKKYVATKKLKEVDRVTRYVNPDTTNKLKNRMVASKKK